MSTSETPVQNPFDSVAPAASGTATPAANLFQSTPPAQPPPGMAVAGPPIAPVPAATVPPVAPPPPAAPSFQSGPPYLPTQQHAVTMPPPAPPAAGAVIPTAFANFPGAPPPIPAFVTGQQAGLPPGTVAPAGFHVPVNNLPVMGVPSVPGAPVPPETQFRLPNGVQCPANYPARAKNWDFRVNTKGDPMLHVIFTLRIGKNEQDEPILIDFPREKRFSFVETAIERTFESLRAMGWEGEDPSEFAEGKGFDLSRQEVDAQLGYGQPYTDDKGRAWPSSPEITWINPLGGIRGTKVDEAELKAWGANIAALRKAKKAGPSAAIRAAVAGGKPVAEKAPDFSTDPEEKVPF